MQVSGGHKTGIVEIPDQTLVICAFIYQDKVSLGAATNTSMQKAF